MGKVIKAVASIGATILGAVVGFAIGGPIGATIGAALFSAAASALLKPGAPRRAATAQQVQLGEQPRQAILGRAAVGGTLVDAFNYGGKDGTDWEVLVLALADHRCDALEGFFVDDTYVAFSGDGTVAGFNGQLQVFWRSGTWDQTVPSILTTYGPGWTANDRGRGVAYVVVAYKADDQKAKNPVWPGGRPRFRWVVRGLRCYDPRQDSTVGGSGAHRRDDPGTWAWSDNPIVIRYNWVRGIYAGDRVTEPDKLLIGRGLSAIEAPPENVFARANLCDELVGGQPRYRIGGLVAANEPFIDVEQDFAAAVGGVISQPEGAVEVDPGEARAPVAHFTDADLLVGSKVTWNERMLGDGDNEWVNTVVARYVEPAQRWNQHSAPVRREIADVLADGGPREAQLSLDFVTSGPQAQRVAEIFRRFGRLWGRAQVTLGPRFSWIEEGDWITWQSDRYFGGATLTFRVEAWGSDQAWHHTLTLRQISASVYSDTAPLDDGSVAADQPAPGPVGQPDADDWVFASALASNGGVDVPVLRFAGAVSDPAVSQVIFEVVQQVAAPGPATEWTFAGAAAPDVTRFDAPALAGGTFWGAVSYVISGIRGDRRVLGPVVADAPPVAEDGTTAELSNPAHVVATAADGSGGDYSAAGGVMRLRRGDAVLGPSFSVVSRSPAGSWISIDASTGAYTVSDPGADTATATLRATLDGVDYDLVYSLAKSRAGAPGADGSPGTPGLNAAVVLIYKRSATQPATSDRPETTTYTFATGALTGTLNGWSTSVPATNGNPLWVRQASASSTGATDMITSVEWSVPVKIAEDGAPGGNSAVVYIYQRATSAPAAPSTTATYTFATGALTGLNNGWSATIPSGSNPLWVRTAVAFGTGSTDTIAPAEWSGASQLVQDGAQGPAGLNAAVVLIYKRSATQPTDSPADGATYTFATGALTGTLNGWSTSVPATNGNPLWVRQASASSTGATDMITSVEWSVPVKIAEDGAPGLNSATVTLYRRSATTPTSVTVSTTYTFATGVLSGANNSWTQAIPSGTDPLWAIQATAASTGSTDTIASGEWTAPELWASPPVNNARILIYRRSPTTPALPSTSSTYTFSTGAISGLNNSWTVTVPSGTDPLWVSVASASSNGDTATIAAASWAGAQLIDEPQPLGNANRVPFSLMERDQGWGVNSNPSSLSVSTSYGSTSGLRFFRATATATAANQDLSIRHSNTFPLLAGSRVSMQARLETTGVGGGAWRLALKGYTASGLESELGAVSGSGLRALTTAAAAAFVDVPAGIVAGRLEFFGRSTGAGSFTLGISEPMVTSASAQQAVHPPFSPGPNALDGADVSLFVSGPVSHTFLYDAAGNLDPAGQMPRDFVFQLRTLAGQITSGVTWQYKIISGSVNGFSAGATLRAMSGSGSGTLTISSFGSNTADVEVIATTSSGSASARIALVKEFAAPNNTGGGGGGANTASQTSGFTALEAGNTSFVTVSQEVQVTAGTTSGQASVNIQVAANGTTGIGGASFEVLLERWNGSSWVSEGAAVADTAYNYTDAEGVPYNEPSAHVFSLSFTVTAGSTVKVRLRARRSGGASVGGLISGSLVLTA